jgi:hypothetical protein
VAVYAPCNPCFGLEGKNYSCELERCSREMVVVRVNNRGKMTIPEEVGVRGTRGGNY